mmetsp:Transcript_9694/g.23991  ORF Transcript_9694/g.23991 Transcript_9694/m.23991 type:complete len:226 (-) Transcript_9694:125-802(-)
MYKPGDRLLNSCSVSPPPKYLRALLLAAMVASNACVPSLNPEGVSPITALTKMVAAPETTACTAGSRKDSAATSRKYPHWVPGARSGTRQGRTDSFRASASAPGGPGTPPQVPSRGTHPHPSRLSDSTRVVSCTSLASTSGVSSSRRASSTSAGSTPLMLTPYLAATYALYSCPPRITWSALCATARIVPILVSSLDPAMTARKGRLGWIRARSAATSFCMSRPA